MTELIKTTLLEEYERTVGLLLSNTTAPVIRACHCLAIARAEIILYSLFVGPSWAGPKIVGNREGTSSQSGVGSWPGEKVSEWSGRARLQNNLQTSQRPQPNIGDPAGPLRVEEPAKQIYD
jgi:hypothetical protein